MNNGAFNGADIAALIAGLHDGANRETWAKAIFVLFPMIDRIHLSKNESVVGMHGDCCVFSFPRPKGWENKNYFRRDFWPEPEPDYSQWIGCFGKFWNSNPDKPVWDYMTDIIKDNSYPFVSDNIFKVNPCGYECCSWAHFEPGLPPEKLPEKA